MTKLTAADLNDAAAIIGTTDKNAVFSICIKTLVDAGVSVRDAVDAVLGAGRFDAMASDIYDELTK